MKSEKFYFQKVFNNCVFDPEIVDMFRTNSLIALVEMQA